ncbi:DUF1654 domain-containing protein [Halomonas organivorans]|uniref:DUF1654 domain-containing protein n=1 Tax=Halomonas organivorans TaxID=257772 RepID=A0A7W5C0L4_9GAMM|nr:DUF1654 domain-containing protein [Halomonas organivorans]MBB3142178.1 hypothetical protein [Halomonas organivorans]
MSDTSAYEQLAQRIQIEIAGANRREIRQVHLRPREDDDVEAWERIIGEIDENENVAITRTPEGWLVSWVPSEV